MLYYIIYIYIVLDRQWSQPLLSILGWLFCLGETCHCRTQEKKNQSATGRGGGKERRLQNVEQKISEAHLFFSAN